MVLPENTLVKPKRLGATDPIHMIAVCVEHDQFHRNTAWFVHGVLPDQSLVVQNTPFYYGPRNWTDFFTACGKIHQQWPNIPYVFIDASWDPVHTSNEDIVQRIGELQTIFAPSKVLLLSAKAQHWFDNISNVLYLPLFAMQQVTYTQPMPRQGRMGCLNRRNALHRIRLMYELLSRNLLDDQRDVYSVNFVNIWSNTRYNFDQSPYQWLGPALATWPDSLATHPDGFVNDYGISHPAWHTAIAIVTETETGEFTLLSEKTAKALVSQSCFTVYMADVGYRVLKDLGFEPRFFDSHAEYDNIEPILSLCSDIATEQDAMDVRQQHLQQIQHNYHWFGNDHTDVTLRPWYSRFEPKLRQALDNL